MKIVDRFSARRPRGFALIVTIVLVAFLVLLLVGLATFTRVETQVAGNSQNLAQARQNALMALNIAVGQLQRHTGPDQRVTATADLQPLAAVNSPSDPVAGRALNTGSTDDILDDIDDHWRDSRNRRWVGVWRDPDPTRSYVDPTNPAATVPTPQLLAWLISGNETNGAAITPQTQVANFDFANVTAPGAPSFSFGTAASPYRLLVGKKTAGIAAADDLDRAVLAPEVKITSTAVPGLAVDPANPPVIGHYAWWVGDEGVKARANLKDDFTVSPSAYENRLRLQSAQRPAVEAMTDMAGLYPANHADLAKILDAAQLPFLNPAAPAFRDELAKRYHDITVTSRGVLADVRNGGLKGDLSWILSRPSNGNMATDLQAIYGSPAPAILATDSIVGRSVFSPHIADPASAPFSTGGANYALGLSRTATWAQLRSFYNIGNPNNAAAPYIRGAVDPVTGKAIARAHTNATLGLHPLVVQAKLFYGLSIDGSGAISLRVRPLVVLANPYDVPLAGDYWVRFGRPSVYVYAGTFTAADPAPSEPNMTQFQRIVSGPGAGPTAPEGSTDTNYNDRPQANDSIPYVDKMTLVISGSDIPPGEARVYCLDTNDTYGGTGYDEFNMAEGYDPGPAITFPSTLSMGTFTHAALYLATANTDVRLYVVDPTSGLSNKLAHYAYGRPSSPSGVSAQFFVVYTTAVGQTRAGGGTWITPHDAQTVGTQQANFLQYNPRTLSSFWTANDSKDHPVENTLSAMRNGAVGNDGYFTADLMFDSADENVRWGPVNRADPAAPLGGQPVAGVSSDTGFKNIFFSLPRATNPTLSGDYHPITSVPQLQHFSPTGYLNQDQFASPRSEQYAVHANTFQVAYPTGNSYPNPRVRRDLAIYADTSDVGSTNMATAYDASWLYNDVLADRFFFSSFPASGAFDFGANRLINRNYRPFRPIAEVPTNNPAGFRGAPRTAATNLLADGAFNINSTSREAWRAVLSSLRDVPVGSVAGVENPIARGLYQLSDRTQSRTLNSAAAWGGFHDLTDDEIADLADEIVLQIRRRGPFLSMADFMNRRLVPAADDPMGRGLSGAVQAAIDAIFNQVSDVAPVFQLQSSSDNLAEPAFVARTLAAGAPGYILQADLLSPLAPNLAARSDTFVVRAYGDVNNPASDEVTGRAWCEAVVQRLPDYVVPLASGGNSPDQKPAAGTDNESFGRRYQIVSFRWLNSDDI